MVDRRVPSYFYYFPIASEHPEMRHMRQMTTTTASSSSLVDRSHQEEYEHGRLHLPLS
ncbi:hypothetical protein SODALDRAFT_333374 [Sodiomyces alkalinus F11]|uniref:Uncharacterized protein n=1 Tax=Sodiomyces alkalinus (strain CBS 110278 / VKM F-3762 / F11) TaxID=1314773 RepID=A0A3N2PWI1_SODAK|nr:hypothetical protein SODALDRAFT_333374 [Sodiomyces alkalinus F11]ROT38746.1 hypothetical protein SODALDRAFT_333374 [Sodiomyces alkalinus F11]